MNKNHKVAVVVALVLSVVVARAWTVRAAEETNPFAVPDAQIIGEIRDHSELMDNLEYLSDRVGPRLTGSARLKQANDWTAEMFKKYGLTNVHLEAYTIPHAWTRGKAEARIISPTEHAREGARAGGVLRCKDARRLREIPRQVARSDRDLPEAAAAFPAQGDRSEPGNLPSARRAASAAGATGAA